MSPAAMVSGALGFGAPDAVAPEGPAEGPAEDLLAPDEVEALDEVLLHPLSKVTEQMRVTPTDTGQWGRIPDPRRLMPPTGPDPDETAMRTGGCAPTGDVFQRFHRWEASLGTWRPHGPDAGRHPGMC
jgi:hypothetical protein